MSYLSYLNNLRPKVTRIVPGALLLVTPILLQAQSGRTTANTLPSRCSVSAAPASVSPQARREAQQLSGRAQAASIQGDNGAAIDLYQRAARLDPSDASIAYSLGRALEAAHDIRAMAEYCRVLALAPTAPEAADVRQRIGELALTLPPDTSIVTVPAAAQHDRMPAPGTALVSGLLIPGLGQFVTHNPIAGLLVMATAAGTAYWGLQSQSVTTQVTRTAIDPLGHAYQYQSPETTSQRPHLAVGVGTAAAISLIAAFQAFAHAQSGREHDARAESALSGRSGFASLSAPSLVVGARAVGLGLAFR